MRINLSKLLTMGLLALFSVSLAHAKEQNATVVVVNNVPNSTYVISNYQHWGNASFSIPSEIPYDSGETAFTGDFYASTDGASFLLHDSNNPNCIDDPQHLLGHCYQASFSYNVSGPEPVVTITENSQPCSSCSITHAPNHNLNDIELTINTSS